jgi:uncharacterized membrane protein (TIGR02234 family)
MTDSPRRDRSFGPTVLVGLVTAALTAVAATKDWARATGDAAGVAVRASAGGSEAAPLVVALALVALASWGVVLVLRGRARRVVAVVGLLACLGALVGVVYAFDGAQDDALAALRDKGATGDVAQAGLTAWYFVTGAAALLTLLTFVVAVLRAPTWPAMGSRYDAPAARAEQPLTEQDLWRALDQGHDPTA